MRVYTNFDEIDQDLRILKLKKQIGEEELKLNIEGIKGGTSVGLSPITSVASVVGGVLQKALVAKLVGKIFGYKRVKEVKDDETYKV